MADAPAIPRRLQMSRLKGSNLHALSYAANGLPVRVVTRSTAFGNPFRFVQDQGCIKIESTEGPQVVVLHRQWLCDDPKGQQIARRIRTELPGHNVACFCPLCPAHRLGLPLGIACQECSPCHGDTTLRIAAGHWWDQASGTWQEPA